MAEMQCEQCGKAFRPRQYNQRFCSGACSASWHEDERRRGLEMLRNTYFGRALLAEAEDGGGRYAQIGGENLAPLAVPNWARDPESTEPPLGIDVDAVPDLGFPEGRRNDS